MGAKFTLRHFVNISKIETGQNMLLAVQTYIHMSEVDVMFQFIIFCLTFTIYYYYYLDWLTWVVTYMVYNFLNLLGVFLFRKRNKM